MEYISAEAPSGCIFCSLAGSAQDRDSLVVARRDHAFAVLNRFPYNNGHLMVCPYRHVPGLEELDAPERLAIVDLAAEATGILREVMRAEGFNLGVNLGKTAGAGVADHVHLHVVPRWNGDTNYMPVTGLTKVVSQHLRETFDALAPRFAARAG
jgi:ATP adenylyltransferase